MSKKGTGRAKRDPNQPTPKPRKKRSRFLIKLLLGSVVVVLSTWCGLYSFQIGKGPLEWTAEERAGFVTFSRQQVDEGLAQVEQVDWGALKGKIKAGTRKLWERASSLEDRLAKKIADLRGQRATPAEGEAPAAATAAEPTVLERGCEAMRAGMGHYKRSMDDQEQLRLAKAKFLEARELLERAHAETSDDPVLEQEVEGYIMECNKYLEDCSKREVLTLEAKD